MLKNVVCMLFPWEDISDVIFLKDVKIAELFGYSGQTCPSWEMA